MNAGYLVWCLVLRKWIIIVNISKIFSIKIENAIYMLSLNEDSILDSLVFRNVSSEMLPNLSQRWCDNFSKCM